MKAELPDITQVEAESSRLYALLQSSVDREIQKTGYLPVSQAEQPLPTSGNNGLSNVRQNGNNGYRQRQNGYRHGYQNHRNQQQEQWQCSLKQQELILKIVHENRLDKQHVEQLSQQLFGIGVRQLNKLQASGLIDELLQQQENRPQGFNPVMAGRAQ